MTLYLQSLYLLKICSSCSRLKVQHSKGPQLLQSKGLLHKFSASPVLMWLLSSHEKGCSKLSSSISNAGVDMDDMLDDLFKKYGKTVFKSNDRKSPIAEVDADAESLSFAVAAARVASDVKAVDIKVLFVKPVVYWTDFFIIATAFSLPQIDAIGTKIKELAEKHYGRVAIGDSKPNSWTLLDFGDVVVHVFLPPERSFYNLEEFYANASPVDLPFENRPPEESS